MKKILISLGILIALLLSAALVVPYFFKDQVVEVLKTEINKSTETKINFSDDIGLSLFKDFPKMSLSIQQLMINSPKGFASDTLVYAETVQLSLDIMSVIKGEKIQIHKILLEKPVVNLFVNKQGINNWDIFKGQEKEEPKEEKPFLLNLEKLKIENATILFKDEMAGFSTELKNYTHTMSGDFTQDIFDMKNELEIEKLSFKKGLITYLNEVNLKADADLNINLKESEYKFLKNKFTINGLDLAIDGMVKQGKKNTDLDLSIEAKEAKFKNFISLIPALYTKDFENIKADGKVSFSAKAKGTYSDNSIPTFKFFANAKDAWFQYPDLKGKVTQINFDLNAENNDGIKENTTVRLKNFSAKMGNNKTAGELTVSKALAENPLIDTKFSFDLKLEELKNYVPMQGNDISGSLQANIKANGKMASMKSGAYEQINAAGFLNAQNVKINSKQLTMPVYINQAKIQLTPNFAQMPVCVGKIGSNDFNASGKLYNLFSFIFSGKTLKAELTTSSNYLDINQLMALTPTSAAQSNSGETKVKAKSTEPLFPDKIDFSLKSTSKKVKYDKLDLSNVKANVQIKDQKAFIETLSFDLWKGTVDMKGVLDAIDSKNPKLNYTIKASALSIMNTVKNFEWLQKYIPIIDKNLVGDFSTKFDMSTSLGEDFKPNLNTLSLDGIFDIANVQLSKFTTLSSIQSQLNADETNKETVTLKNLLLNVAIKEGNLQVKPFNFKLGEVPINIGGITNVNSNINYNGKVEIPAKMLKGNQQVLNNLTAKTPFKSLQIGENDKLDLALNIGGTLKNPQLKLNLKEVGKGLKQSVTNAVKTEIETQKNKLINQAENKANEEIKKQTDKVNEKVNEEVNKQTDKVKDEVGKKLLKGLFGGGEE